MLHAEPTDRPLPQRRRLTFRGPVTAAALIAAALGAAACGSSNGSSTSSRSSASSSPPAAAGGTTGAPLSKADYEAKGAPLLSGAGQAISQAFGSRVPDSQKLAKVTGVLQGAHDQMQALNPPTAIASVHKNAVATLGKMVEETSGAENALNKGDRKGELAALGALKVQARRFQMLGSQFTALGY